ncbi:MAG TPA: hypothetical protein VMR14_12205 [Streptosporangiaceae bacterium]|nr:hypothetical protein [Streptosporangiaceae bacterium]
MPGRRGEQQVELARGPPGLPGLEGLLDDGDLRVGGEVGLRLGGQVGAELDAGDLVAASGQRKRRLAGAAADLEQLVALAHASELDEFVE